MGEIFSARRASNVFIVVLRQELVLLWRERSLPVVVLLLSALLAGGLANGLWRVAAKDAQLARLTQEQNALRETVATQLKAAEASGAATPFTSPLTVIAYPGSQYAMMPTLPLAPVALGQSDLLPNYLQLVGLSETQLLYESDIENPWHLAIGHFDAAFVIVFLVPLLIFSVSYNLMSAERERGILRLLMAQPVSPRAVALGKAATRALVLCAPLLALPLAAALLFRPVADRALEFAAFFGLWAALAVSYALFWLALAVWINAFGRSSAFNALTLVGVWVGVTLAAPIALNLAVDTAAPALSRARMVDILTEATEDSARRNAELDRTDYAAMRNATPQDGKCVVQPTLLRGLNMQKEVSEAMRPWAIADERRGAERRALVDLFRVLSPAATAFEGMSVLAGTDARRYASLQSAAADLFRSRMTRAMPRLSAGVPVTEAEFRSTPGFVWSEDWVGQLWLGGVSVAQLLAPTAAVILAALFKLSKLSV